MQLTDELAELIAHAGLGVLDNADSFRAALDDFLTPDVASRGVINLLVDAVRQGAVDRLLRDISHGGDPAHAVDACGDQLARDRATSEVQSSRWALAVLGFAAGVVDQGTLDVHQAHAPVASVPVPATPSVPTPVLPAPPVPAPAPDPLDEVSDTEVVPSQTVVVPVAGSHVVDATPNRRRRLMPLATAAAVLAASGIVAAVVLSGSDDPGTKGNDDGPSTSSDSASVKPVAASDPASVKAALRAAADPLLPDGASHSIEAANWDTSRGNLDGAGFPKALPASRWRTATTWHLDQNGDSGRLSIYVSHNAPDEGPSVCSVPEVAGEKTACSTSTTSDGRVIVERWTVTNGFFATHNVSVRGTPGVPSVTASEQMLGDLATIRAAKRASTIPTDALRRIATDPDLLFPLPDQVPGLPSFWACKFPNGEQPTGCPSWIKPEK